MHAPTKSRNRNVRRFSSATEMACTSSSSISQSNRESLEDCMCTICLCIFIHPVTLPCGHELCMPCFKQTVEEASLTCPLCRTRISTWARKAAKTKTLVNQKRWEQIQRLFPQRVQRRLDGLDDETDEEIEEREEIDVSYRRMVQLSKPGEIREEYEAELKRLTEERRREEEASAALIRCLRSREEQESLEARRQKELIAARDAELAQELGKIINQVETETPINRLLQEARDNYPNQQLQRSNSSTPSLGSRVNFDKGKQPQVKNTNKTLETFFRRVPGGTRTSGRCWSEPRPADSEFPSQKGFANTDPATLRPVSAPVRDKENLPDINSAHVSDFYEAVNIGDVYPQVDLTSVEVEKVEIGKTYTKDHVRLKRSDSVSTVHSDGSDSVIVCEPAEVIVVKDDEQNPQFKPIESSPQTPPYSVSCSVPIEPCVVRITPRHLFSTSSVSTTVFPVAQPCESSRHQPASHSETDMGTVKSKFIDEEPSVQRPKHSINGVGPSEQLHKRARSTSPQPSRILPNGRRVSDDDSHRSPFARATLDDIRHRAKLHTPTQDLVSDIDVSSPSTVLRVNEPTRTKQSSSHLKAVRGCDNFASHTDGSEGGTAISCCVVDGKTLSGGPCNGADAVRTSPCRKLLLAQSDQFASSRESDSCAWVENTVRPLSPQPSTSAEQGHADSASSDETLKQSRPVGIFNPATIPAWSEALFVETIKGKGKRLMKKSANSSISERNSPKRSGKSHNISRSVGETASSNDAEETEERSGVLKDSEAEGNVLPSTHEGSALEKVGDSGVTSRGRKTAAGDLCNGLENDKDSNDLFLTDSDSTHTNKSTAAVKKLSLQKSARTETSNDSNAGLLNVKCKDDGHIDVKCRDDHLTGYSEERDKTVEGQCEETDDTGKLVRRVRRQGRGARAVQNPPAQSEPRVKSVKPGKGTKTKSSESEKNTNQQRSIKDWFSPNQAQKTSLVPLKRKSPKKSEKETVSDTSDVSSVSSLNTNSPQKTGVRTSNRVRKVNTMLDSFLLISKLQQLQASPSKSSDSTPESSPCKSTPPRRALSKSTPSNSTPTRGPKRKLNTSSDRNSPAKRIHLTPSKSPVKTYDSDSRSTREECFSSADEEEEEGLSQEEKDLRLALRLQRQFELADKLHLKIVRFKGTDDQYSLRAGRSGVKK